MKLRSLASIVLHTTRMLLSLLALWLSLGWKVRKARKAFEKELVKAGIAKKDAKKLSLWFSKLKDDITQTVKASLFSWR
ncbi:MAG: hypothetical protein NZ932_02465 [Candidatus Bathyarchaeota archaeon]|nr:hypothetical protein [Candidatus Bathyarchaeota archaeon]MDW8040645.1 hypothetical protein [Nitrososphaerota archaeon]